MSGCLQVVRIEELKEDDVYEEIYDDMKDECCKYGELQLQSLYYICLLKISLFITGIVFSGTLVNIVIPRPSLNEDGGAGVGKVLNVLFLSVSFLNWFDIVFSDMM